MSRDILPCENKSKGVTGDVRQKEDSEGQVPLYGVANFNESDNKGGRTTIFLKNKIKDKKERNRALVDLTRSDAFQWP